MYISIDSLCVVLTIGVYDEAIISSHISKMNMISLSLLKRLIFLTSLYLRHDNQNRYPMWDFACYYVQNDFEDGRLGEVGG